MSTTGRPCSTRGVTPWLPSLARCSCSPARGSRVSRAAKLLTTVIAALTLAPTAQAATATTPELRVEAAGTALSPAVHYSTGPVSFSADAHPACRGSGNRITVEGPNALGVLYDAQATSPALRPVRTSDRFSFGLFLCGIGDYLTGTDRYWVVRVNWLTPQVGADRVRVTSTDRVLWYYVDTTNGSNTGDMLELRAPARARAGQPVGVTVLAHDGKGGVTPAAGALVYGAVTDVNGRATLTAPRARTLPLRATGANDVASAPIAVCLSDRLRRCPRRRGWTIVGRDRPERLVGTRGGDVVDARAGDDRIDVRGGDRDRVRCGAGRDAVLASRGDRISRDCERVRLRR